MAMTENRNKLRHACVAPATTASAASHSGDGAVFSFDFTLFVQKALIASCASEPLTGGQAQPFLARLSINEQPCAPNIRRLFLRSGRKLPNHHQQQQQRGEERAQRISEHISNNGRALNALLSDSFHTLANPQVLDTRGQTNKRDARENNGRAESERDAPERERER